MKNFTLLALSVLLLAISVAASRGQVLTQTSITEAQWNTLSDSTANPQNLSGIWTSIGAGSPNPDVPEFGLGAPFQGGFAGNVPGGWNFNTPYQFSLTNDLGGGYRMTITQGSTVYQATEGGNPVGDPVFRPTTPYVDLVFVVRAEALPWKPAIEITNLTLTLGGVAYSLPDLSAGITEPQNFQGFILDGAGENWTSIAGTFVPRGDLSIYPPSVGDFSFSINGTTFQQTGAVPEPSTEAMIFLGMIVLLYCGRMRDGRWQLSELNRSVSICSRTFKSPGMKSKKPATK